MLQKLPDNRKKIDMTFINFIENKLPILNVLWKKVVEEIQKNGLWDQWMEPKPELKRVRDFLYILEHGEQHSRSFNLNEPCPQGLPCFPVLNNQPIHEVKNYSWTKILSENFITIKNEVLNIQSNEYIDFDFDNHMTMMSAFPLFDKGEEILKNTQKLPETVNVLRQIPRLCDTLPSANILISKMPSGTHLPRHCSIDNFRLRLMLGIVTPEDCFINVCNYQYHWKVGEIFLWEDSFEHEVRNKSQDHRIILVLDTWHPDLTDIETKILHKVSTYLFKLVAQAK